MPLPLKGRTCLVTGASSGIGLWTAKALAAQGARVVMLCRNADKGQAAVEEIRAATPEADAHVLLADLYVMKEVRRAAVEYRERFDALHVLVNNAGLIHGSRQTTPEGLERTFALNHLAPFLLTHELVDLLERCAPSRVVTVASVAHKVGRFDLENLQAEKGYSEMRVYGTSKLCNILFSGELARKLKGAGVTSNSLHPGTVRSNFGGSGSWFYKYGTKIAAPFFISGEKGARTSVYLAGSPEVEGVTGRYFVRCREATPSSAATSEENAKALWQYSCQAAEITW